MPKKTETTEATVQNPLTQWKLLEPKVFALLKSGLHRPVSEGSERIVTTVVGPIEFTDSLVLDPTTGINIRLVYEDVETLTINFNNGESEVITL